MHKHIMNIKDDGPNSRLCTSAQRSHCVFPLISVFATNFSKNDQNFKVHECLQATELY